MVIKFFIFMMTVAFCMIECADIPGNPGCELTRKIQSLRMKNKLLCAENSLLKMKMKEYESNCNRDAIVVPYGSTLHLHGNVRGMVINNGGTTHIHGNFIGDTMSHDELERIIAQRMGCSERDCADRDHVPDILLPEKKDYAAERLCYVGIGIGLGLGLAVAGHMLYTKTQKSCIVQ